MSVGERSWQRVAVQGAGSLALAGGICRALWQLVPAGLNVRTPIVGSPIFSDYHFAQYFDAYDLCVFAFPILAIVLYAAADRVARSDGRPRRTALLPIPLIADEAAGDGAAAPGGGQFGAAARGVVVGLALALEFGSLPLLGQRTAWWAYLVGAAYVALSLGVALLHGRGAGQRLQASSTLNSLGALAVVPLLYLVSRSTNVEVLSTGADRVVPYPWFPWWAAVIACVLAVGWWLRARRRGASALELERTAVFILAVPVLLFLLTAMLPGVLGYFGAFDDAQDLAGAQLTFSHGLLPWRDVYLLHGLFEDDFDAQIGFGVFSHTRWGAVAGIDMFVRPASFVIDYLFAWYFARSRRRFVAWLCLPAALAGQLVVTPRFIFLPLLLVLLDAVFRRRGRGMCVLLGVALVVESVVTAEIVLMSLCVLATLVVFEFCTRPKGQPLLRSFPLLLWTTVGGLAAGIPFLIYLVATSSLTGFIDYFRVFGSDHALWGALPVQWSFTHDYQTSIEFVLPVVLLLLTVLLVCWRLRTRRGLTSRQWCLVAAAAFVASYYQKVLDRLDAGHVAEIFSVAIPLVLLAGVELLDGLDGVVRGALFRTRGAIRALRVAPLTLLASVLVLVGVPVVVNSVTGRPALTHNQSDGPAPAGLLGYTAPGTVKLAEVNALGRVLDLVVPTGPVFDFANEPGIVYFLLNRTPGADSFHVESAQTPLAQQLVIDDLERSRPRATVFTDFDFGVPTLDGIPGPVRDYLISRYLLTHYRPYAEVDGQMVLIRSDLVGKVAPASSLHISGVTNGDTTTYDDTFICQMDDVGNFLSAPTPLSGAGAATPRVSAGSPITRTIEGWAVDDEHLEPAREVFAEVDGRVVGSAQPDLLRPDIVAYFHSQAVAYSGFELFLNVPSTAKVKLFALNADGTLSRIQPDPALSLPSSLRSAGPLRGLAGAPKAHYKVARGTHLSGWVTADIEEHGAEEYRLSLPVGEEWTSFEWATVAVHAKGATSFTLSAQPGAAGGAIEFNALPGNRTLLLPLGSCSQWYGWGSTLLLVATGNSKLSAITLYR